VQSLLGWGFETHPPAGLSGHFAREPLAVTWAELDKVLSPELLTQTPTKSPTLPVVVLGLWARQVTVWKACNHSVTNQSSMHLETRVWLVCPADVTEFTELTAPIHQ
jgi:hypothetical protein